MTTHVLTLDSPTRDTLEQGGSRPAVMRYVELSAEGTPRAVLFLPPDEFEDMGRPSQIELDPTPGPDSEPVPVQSEGIEILEESGTDGDTQPVA